MQPATGLSGQFEVLNALILRELKTRFGSNQLGYLWALIEPSLWIGTFVGFFFLLGRSAPAGLDPVSFIATGLIPYSLFRDTANRAVSAIGANKGLLFYPQVQPLDLVLARTVLEFVTFVMVFGVIIGAASMWRGTLPEVADWLQLMFGFVAAGTLGASLGLLLTGLSVFAPVIERLHGPVLRPLFWISGVFFTANGLPPAARDFMLYNPVLHIVEFVRNGWFVEYRSQYADMGYVMTWIISLSFFGLVVETDRKAPAGGHVISLERITKAYPVNHGLHLVLDDVSLDFPPRTNVGIVGNNGAGKSTLLRIIAGVEAPDQGRVTRQGRVSWPIGFAGGFNGSLSGEENCRFVARIYGESIDNVVGFTREFAELREYFEMPVRTYSSGMRARLAFGLSMAIDFDVYLVDEVTAVGDASFQQKCREAFESRSGRSSVIIVSHNLKTIREYCSTCAVLQHGRVVLCPSVDEARTDVPGMSTTPLKQVTLPEHPPAADGKEAKAAAEAKEATPPPVPAAAKAEPAKGRRPEAAKAPAPDSKPKAAPIADPRATLVKPAPAEAKPTARPSTPTKSPEAAPVVALPTTEPVRNAAAAVRALRRARARRLGIRVALGVGLPTIVASIYFFLVASSQYESVSLFMVNSAEARASIGLESLIGAVPGAPATRDTLAVRDFIISRDMLEYLEQRLQLSKHYEDPASDWWARLSSKASSEHAYDYYREMVRVDHDSSSGVVTLRVRAFSPEFAKKVADAVIAESEKMVNQLSDRVRADQTKLAQSEVASAEARLSKARQAIVKLQQDHAEFNPEKTATEAFTLRGELKGEMARARAELMEARSFMQPDAPRVVALEERVRSLSVQVSEESGRLVSPKGESGLGNAMAMFDAAMVEKEFAQGAYRSALTSLEVARSETARQHRYLATIAKPSQPTAETHPKRVRGVITVVLLSAMVLGMAMLLVEAVREHARI